MNAVLVLVAFVAAWMVAGVILASAIGPRLRRCSDAGSPARHEVVLGSDHRGVEPLRWVLPASIVVMAVASSTGLAAAGVLPPPVQVVARSVFGTVGLDVPDAQESTKAEGGAATPERPAATGPVAPPVATGTGTPPSGGSPATTAPSAADESPDPFLATPAAPVADHSTSGTRPVVPTPGGSTMSGNPPPATADAPPAPPPPRDSRVEGGEPVQADPVPEQLRGPSPVRTPVTRPRAPEVPDARPPVAPVVEAPTEPAAPVLPPPAAATPGRDVVPRPAAPDALARQEREQRRLAKEQEKAAKKVQSERMGPVLPPPPVEPAAPTPPTDVGP